MCDEIYAFEGRLIFNFQFFSLIGKRNNLELE